MLGFWRIGNRAYRIGWVCLLGCFVLLAVFLSLHADQLIDSDASAELILAKHLFDSGQVISPDWYYPTELRVVHEWLFFAPFFAMFDSWHAVRVAGTLMLCAVYVASFIFLCRAMGMKALSPWLACILVLPFSNSYAMYVLFLPHLTANLAIVFLVFGLVLRNAKCTLRKWRVFLCLAMVALSFMAGLSGLRQIESLFVPLFLAGALVFCLKRTPVAQGVFSGSAACLLGGSAGYLVNVSIFRRFFTWHSYADMKWQDFDMQSLADVFGGLLNSFGYAPNVKLVSSWSVINGIALLLFLSAFLAVAWVCFLRRSRCGECALIVAWFILLGIAELALVFCFTDMPFSPRYVMPYAVLGLPLLGFVLKTAYVKKGGVDAHKRVTIAISALCLLALTSCALNYRVILQTDRTEFLRPVAKALVEMGETEGYASFWNADVLVELSNGEVEAWSLCDTSHGAQMRIAEVYRWNQIKSHTSRSPGDPFIVFSVEEMSTQALAKACANSAVKLYDNQKYVVYKLNHEIDATLQ